MRRAVAAIAAAACVLASGRVEAQEFCGAEPTGPQLEGWDAGEEMRFEVVELQDTRRVLAAVGVIGPNDGARLRTALQNAGPIDEIWFNSPGGVVDAGIAMGRVIREYGLFVRVPSGLKCASSCSIAFLGGVLRQVDPGAGYGIHMFSLYFDATDAGRKVDQLVTEFSAVTRRAGDAAGLQQLRARLMQEEQRAARSATKLAGYLLEMSASMSWLTGMVEQEQLGMCFLNEAGQRRYNVTNIE